MAEKKVRASASIRKIAARFGIDLSKIKGSGKKGFIKKTDIESLIPEEAKVPAGKFKRSIQIVTHRHCQKQLFTQVEHRPEGMVIIAMDPICFWCRRSVAGETDFVGDRRDHPEMAAIIQNQMVAEETYVTESLKEGGED